MSDQWVYFLLALPTLFLIEFAGYFIKSKRGKYFYLLVLALLCFFFHVSTMYTSFFENVLANNTRRGTVADNQIFPIFFCNFIMYLQLIVAGWAGDKKGKIYQNFATFTAWAGIFGGMITLTCSSTNFHSWSSFQSSLSHSFLIATSLYLFVAGYVKINVYNLVPYSFGLLGSGLVGGLVALIFKIFGHYDHQKLFGLNPMYLYHGPGGFEGMIGYYFAPAMLGIIFVICIIYEALTKKKEDQWFKSAADLTLYLIFPKQVEERLLGRKCVRVAQGGANGEIANK